MKILVAYDGSPCSDAALDDLVRAGLPDSGTAVVISVSEFWMTSNSKANTEADPYIEELLRKSRETSEKAFAEAVEMSDRACLRLKTVLPKWDVTPKATFGSPAWEVLTAADEIKPDLIVVGSHGHSAISRFVLGSISQKILTEARCSVRVARGRIEIEPAPERIIIGFDCTDGANAAVLAVSRRNWGKGSEIRLIAIADPVRPSLVGELIPPIRHAVEEINKSEREWIERQAHPALAVLRDAGLAASLLILEGNPKHVLPKEAETWGADCIFVGATANAGRVKRFLLGSTASAIAARAHCTVEVVRE